MPDVDLTVIGGGIVGAATAAAAAERGWTTVLLEREERLGAGTTSRNSEVAHGGMYYTADSLKARFCVTGRHLLREFCAAADLPWRACGKVIVAVTEAEIPELERLHDLGETNGVEDLQMLDATELQRLEPAVRAVAGLLSPETAVFSAEETTRAYGRLAGERGAQILTRAQATALERRDGAWHVSVAPAGDAVGEAWQHSSRCVVNAAGLYADAVARLAGIDVDARGWRLHWVKGNYFGISARHAGRIARLVYPCPPSDASLGIHVCVDLAGQLRLGPDMEPLGCSPAGPAPDGETIAREDYSVAPERREAFLRSASRYLPFLEPDDLTPAWAGIRPRRSDHGFGDFVIFREEGELEGLVNLVGIDSPGLTSAPAIARYVMELLAD
jgi:L-2-hydroxyglutarate oxidase LhgO